MTRKWDATSIINERIYMELDIIEEESKKSVQMGAIKDRSAQIAVEMNFLRKVIEYKDGQINMAEFSKKTAEDRVAYLETRLREEKAKREDE